MPKMRSTDVMQRGSLTRTLFLTGDVGPCRSDSASMFQHVASRLRAADIGFCQLEPALTLRGEAMPQARLAMRAPPNSAAAIHSAGFHVVSCAGNHCLDFGDTGLRDTIASLTQAGLMAVGVGANIEEARRPALIDARGVQFAFLAYSSILPRNYDADRRRAGCTPLRAYTNYEQVEHDQPGTPARVHTFVHREDLSGLQADVAAASKRAHHVVVSIHWGVHFVPGELAAYQREMAHAAVDAGAALVVGHHPHVLKGIELYRGVPIFYSLGNFALDPPTAFAGDLRNTKGFREIQSLTKDWDERTLLPPDTLLSLLIECRCTRERIEEVHLIPVHLNANCEPTIPAPDDPAFARVVEYLDWTCANQGMPVPYRRRENYLAIETAMPAPP